MIQALPFAAEVIRIGSIDLGTRIEIETLDDLLDYKSATSEFALAKAALALSGFSPETVDWPRGITLRKMLEHFGGGIELTTLAAIPKGSGLGTSSIVGVVILAVLHRVLGIETSRQRLFHGVLRLEQALTTGGGWQDQIGGAVDGIKVAFTEPGLVPDARIHYVPSDILDPAANGSLTLLYYTGITRLADAFAQDGIGCVASRSEDDLHSPAGEFPRAPSRQAVVEHHRDALTSASAVGPQSNHQFSLVVWVIQAQVGQPALSDEIVSINQEWHSASIVT